MPPSLLRPLAALFLALLLLPPAPAYGDGFDVNVQPTPGHPAAPPTLVPPAPTGHVLDQTGVFQPEAAARLSAHLTAAAAGDVHVYVVTLRTLGVPASQRLDKIQTVAQDYAKTWAKDKVGAILLFDDEGGLMTVEFTPATERRFAGFAVEAAVKVPLGKIQHSGLARDKLEQSAYVITKALLPLQAKWVQDTHRQRTANLIMGAVAFLGLALALYSALAKPKPPHSPTTEPATEKKLSPLDF